MACENSQTAGVTASSTWDITDAGDDDIQGFATDISANAGQSISFKIDTTLAYTINIYRLGYYGGSGARLWQSNLSHSAPVRQNNCTTDPSVLLYDCGNWSVSATWAVPSNAVSGVYIAKLTANNGDSSHITFIVRNDASTSAIVYQTSDQTWQAYNTFGGSDFYTGTTSLTGSQARAFKISYNRPFATRGLSSGRDFLFSNEYPTIRFLERNGYDVSYISGVDADRSGALLLNHSTYLSVGHDEYWSAQQRQNVEYARDHGVNLMFLSGNEVYWHTRFEPSIDGSNTAYRTLVCYKDTWDNAKIDPSTQTTSTWRDPRFGTAPNSASPENALTGTMYMSNSDDLPITVTAAEGKTRLWRNTGLSSMTGASTPLAPHTIGYESDEDVDNGFRPAGLIDLSTTVGSTPQYLQDFGSVVAPGTTTHHVTLYRASSGALVFGAGTIQWGWGLDAYHDGNDDNVPADARMQQATINMLADMRALPTTLMSGMVAPTASNDTQAPTVSVTTPTNGATIANGAQVTVSGTAADVGGGQVAGVEVSLDAGSTWHPATGKTSWTYSGVIHGSGSSSIKVRATDDSANTSIPTTIAQNVTCPCSLFGATTPATPDGGDASSVEVGVRFSSSTDGYVSGVRFYKAAANTGTHIGSLWSSSGSLLAAGTFTGESASGWQTLQFASPVAINAGTTYVVSYYAPNGHYSADSDYFYYGDYQASPLSAQTTGPNATSANGVFSTAHGFPSDTYHAGNYYVDVLFSGSASVAPTVVSQTPSADSSSVATSVTPTATFSKAMNAASIAFAVTDSSSNTVTGTVTYDSTSKTAKFTPTAALATGTLYTVTVTGSDVNGNQLPSPATWSFRTVYPGQVGGACPCTVFSDSSVPAVVTVQDPGSVELGIKFTADSDGIVTGVRFYKGPQNIGSHTGSLWSSTGTQLATATFSNETSTGWQTVSFASPVAVTAGSTYVASYHTSVGYYSATVGAYATAGVDNFPLHVPVNGSVYTYSTAFPNSSSTADYGVDVVFTVPASLVPTVASADPSDGDSNISTASALTATFNTSILAGTTSMTVTPSGGSPIAGTATLDSLHRVLTFTPAAALATGTTYTVSVSGARTLAGTPQASTATWSFSTGGGATCPCSLFASNATPATIDGGDASAITVGTKIVPSSSGFITAVRFYKSAANTGTHTGSLWNAAGTRLATVTFSSETASGWQRATFSQPIPVTAGTTYTIGYYTPTGHYSASSHFFDNDYVNGLLTVPGGTSGVYRYGSDAYPNSSFANTNYWVDAVFNTTAVIDAVPPTVDSTSPINGATSVAVTVAPSVVFSEPVTPESVVMTLTDAGGNAIVGAATYDAPSQTVTFTPTNPLAAGVRFTATVSATDVSGNAMATPLAWTFRTALPVSATCPCSIWNDASTPATITDPDGRSIEVGVQFSADTSGQIIGARFYKGPQNNGTHTATLWSADGVQLATGTFTGESSTGWQTMTFATPVTVTVGASYVISYHATGGNFSATAGAFTNVGFDNSPLHVPANGGRYLYGSGGFPTGTSDANYWADAVFQPMAPDTTAPVVSGVSVTSAGPSSTVIWTTDEPATTRVDYGTSATALTLSATASGLVTAHSVALPGLTSGTAYFYRVTSADAAGNSTTSPAIASAAATFTSADTVAPVVTAVAATGSGGTATVTWTTNEASTSQVAYGTSATALTLSATASGLVTAHSVALAGLTANTRYYYRVTSADASANSTTSPAAASAAAVYVPTTTPFVDTTTASFATGTAASTYVTADGDGGVVLLPTTATDFTATTLPSGWTSTSTVTGGSTTFAAGTATVKGANLYTSAGYSTAKSLEVQATLNRNQSIGWAASATSSTKFALSVNASNQLIATVNDGLFTNVTSVLATGWTPAIHKFRIEWSSTSVTFYLDDVSKFTRTFFNFGTSSMRPVFSDTVLADAGLILDWVRVGPYAATGTFTSRTIDASAPVIWDGLSWDSSVPAGTTLTVRVRTGNTATPDGTWSAYTTIPATGGLINKTSRYLQYQLTLTSTGTRYVTATIRSVQVGFHV